MKRLRKFLIFVPFVVSATGCALGEYEARIDTQLARLKVLDEENRLLGDFIELPKVKGKDEASAPVWPFDVYLRLPKELGGMFREKNLVTYQDLPLVPYTGGRDGYAVLTVAAGLIAEKKEKGKDAKSRPGEWLPETFRSFVHGALSEYYRKDNKSILPDFPAFDRAKFQKMDKQRVDERGNALPTIQYEAIAFKDDWNRTIKDHSLFQAYFHEQDGKQVAIIVQCPLPWREDPNLIGGVDMSLKTLEVGPIATNKRLAMLKRKQLKK